MCVMKLYYVRALSLIIRMIEKKLSCSAATCIMIWYCIIKSKIMMYLARMSKGQDTSMWKITDDRSF